MAKAKARSQQSAGGGISLDHVQLAQLTDLMDELAFRGPMQEALMVRVANVGGFHEVLARIKKRRLYVKRRNDAEVNGDESQSTPKGRARKGKGKTRKARKGVRNDSGSQSGEGEGQE